MARYPLNLPMQLKHEAEEYATGQGVSLNQFILWAVAEKIGALRQHLDDPDFPHITYRRKGRGPTEAVVRGRNIRVQTLVAAANKWGLDPSHLAEAYDLTAAQVKEALAFYEAHHQELDASIAAERTLDTDASTALP